MGNLVEVGGVWGMVDVNGGGQSVHFDGCRVGGRQDAALIVLDG